MRHLSALVMTCIASTTVMAQQAQLIEKVTRKGNELVIPYEKYRLPNGLTVIIHEDHSDPLVHVDVTYHVGSAREEIGKSGFAHFFEHMMFQGSDHVADEQHFKIVSDAGGTLNGTTNRDRTNYFETMPRNQVEVALWLEADRMGFLLDAVTQQKFEIQRATVKNERGQNYDNRPYGLVSENISKTLYPNGHPYSWLTIGYIEDLNRVNVNDLKNFFLRWYGPNNAVLTIGGDISAKDVLPLVEKYFGPIPMGPAVNKMYLPPPLVSQDKYISMEDNIRFPLLQMVYPTIPHGHVDEPAIDLLAAIYGEGKSSIFYQKFIKSQQASNVNVYQQNYELAGEMNIGVYAVPGSNLSEVEQQVREALAGIENHPDLEGALERAKASIETMHVTGLESVSGKVSQLAYNETFFGNPNRVQSELESYKQVTAADIMRVYKQYIKGRHAVIMSAVPKGQTQLIAHEDNAASPQAQAASEKAPGTPKLGSGSGTVPSLSVAPKNEYANLVYKKATDNFDRSKKPTPGPNPVVTVPALNNSTLKNGIPVMASVNNEIPFVNLQIAFKGGRLLEPEGKAGLAQITENMLDESTQNYSAETISDALDKLGSEIRINSDGEGIYLTVRSLSKNLDATLKLAEEKLLRPKFSEEDFKLVKKLNLEAVANQGTQATVIASNVFNQLIFGTQNPKGIAVSEASLNSITLDDVKSFYNRILDASVAEVVVVGDFNPAAISTSLAWLETVPAKKTSFPATLPYNKFEKTKLYLVNKDNAPQSEIRIGYVALPYDALGEQYRLRIANFVLGGTFNSRINLNLREDKGYTYGARSSFNGTRYPGSFVASAGVKGNTTDSAVVEFIKEINGYTTRPITAEELAYTRNSLSQSEALRYETQMQRLGFMKVMLDYQLPADYTRKQFDILAKISSSDINTLAKQYLDTNHMVIVVVGDKKKILPGLQRLGYEITELDKEGKPVN